MKRKLGFFIVLLVLVLSVVGAQAATQRVSGGVYQADGTKRYTVQASVMDFCSFAEGEIVTKGRAPEQIEVPQSIAQMLSPEDWFALVDVKTDNEENPYPAVENGRIKLHYPTSTGSTHRMGKDYRLFSLDAEGALTDISACIEQENFSGVSFSPEKLGVFVLLFDRAVYDVSFYLDEPQYDEEGELLNPETFVLYHSIENLKEEDVIVFPPIPTRSEYVFTGWKSYDGGYGASRAAGGWYAPGYTMPQPHAARHYSVYYASWCRIPEYRAIRISTEANIIKGFEDGATVVLSTNYGMFSEDWINCFYDWRALYDAAESDEEKEEIKATWDSIWKVEGLDGVSVEKAERINDTMVKLTLTGNSENPYTSATAHIAFDYRCLIPLPQSMDGELVDGIDTRIQMDEDGVRRSMYETMDIYVKPYEIKESFSTAAYGLDGKRQLSLRKCAANVIPLSEDIENEIEHPQFSIIANDLLSGDEREIEIDDQVLAHAGESDRVIFFDIRGNDPENPYPDIKKLTIKVFMPPKGGGITPKIGKDYRLFYVGEELVDMTDCITEAEKTKFTIQTDRLGKYVLYANSACYEVTFHYDLPICDENDELLNPDTYIVYHRIENLKANDVVDFPPIPEREGYVFTGWKEWRGSGIHYTEPQPIHASHNTEYYATWCKEEEYEPLKVEISSKKPIRKGKEDGAVITLTTNYGIFTPEEAYEDYWGTWKDAYDAETDAEVKESIIAEWKSVWNVVGVDGVMVLSAKRLDDKTVELVLCGNSENKNQNAKLQIEFTYHLLGPEFIENPDKSDESWWSDYENYDWDNQKIQMDEDGVERAMYISDNSIKVKQASVGGGGGSISYTVTFNTDGGSAVEKQKVEKNASAKMPEAPQKEGYIFIGWYKDEAHTEGYDFEAKVTENITLYAAWEEKTIVLTIGETKAMVFGREVQIDAAPMIQNDRTMLPIRFIAESLGAEVLWEEETKTVTVKNTDKVIKIVIGEAKALVGEEEKDLDSAAFIENNRTYLPLRFIAENLGAKVTYEEETRTVTVAVQ